MTKILRQYKVTLEKIDSDKNIIGEYPDNLGMRTKLGGNPEWIQSDETPQCLSCKEKMSFVGQIDSLEHQSKLNPHSISCTSPDQQYMFGDVGIIYIFFCFDCLETRSLVQFY